MVKTGEAVWLVVARERGVQKVACRLCSFGLEPEASCDLCKGTGLMDKPAVWDTYNGDIVLVVHRTKTNKVSTPRVATIEEEHIIRAYVDEVQAAAERIEEYGQLGRMVLQELGAEVREGRKILFNGKPEPENKRLAYAPGSITFKDGSKNKSWYWVVEGRDNDYGRAI